MGKSQQRKGADGERELMNLLTAEGFDGLQRGGYCYGEKPDLYGLPDIHIECKRVEKLNLHAAMQQAEQDAERFKDGKPTVFHRRNRSPWLVTMHFRDWIEIYKKAVQN